LLSFADAELNISTGKTDAVSDEFRFFYEQVIEEYM